MNKSLNMEIANNMQMFYDICNASPFDFLFAFIFIVRTFTIRSSK